MAKQLPILPPKRTEGDGMENTSAFKLETATKRLSVSSSSGSSLSHETIQSPNKESIANLALISLKPTIFPKRKISGPLSTIDMKEPKFVPYEPYKAAVRPIVPRKKGAVLKKKFSTTLKELKVEDIHAHHSVIQGDTLSPKSMDEDFIKLKQENEELEKQLKFQVQVNGDLKNLLVAAVGEDMETRVHSLTEDKLHLAQALLKSAKSLSTHQEQVEWLAGQCEVWRSKFLASSVIVEELARWKASLSHKICEGQDVVKNLLAQGSALWNSIVQLHDNLTPLRDNFDLHSKRSTSRSANIVDLTDECVTIVSGLSVQLLGGNKKLADLPQMSKSHLFTNAEKSADQFLKNPYSMQLIDDPDGVCNAVMGAAVSLSGHLYQRNNPPRITACSHCTGQIKLV